MELRHLRYFVAVAEEGSMTLAAERRLHTAQPSLSRQLRDLEQEVGVALLTRSPRGVDLTPAGRAFLDHARLALSQIEAAGEAARRAANPGRASFAMGFLTGHEVEWLAEAMRLMREELPDADIHVTSQTSPELAAALLRGKIDVAFIRPEADMPDLAFTPLIKEPLLVVLPSDHRLATQAEIDVSDLADESFVGVSATAPTLRVVIAEYLRRNGLAVTPAHAADNLSGAISLVASTRSVALLPAYARNFLPWSVVSRPIAGTAPTIDLVLAHHKANRNPVLKNFLARRDELIVRVMQQREHRRVSGKRT